MYSYSMDPSSHILQSCRHSLLSLISCELIDQTPDALQTYFFLRKNTSWLCSEFLVRVQAMPSCVLLPCSHCGWLGSRAIRNWESARRAVLHFCPPCFLQGCNSLSIIGQLLCPDKPSGRVRRSFSSGICLSPVVSKARSWTSEPTGLQPQTLRAPGIRSWRHMTLWTQVRGISYSGFQQAAARHLEAIVVIC